MPPQLIGRISLDIFDLVLIMPIYVHIYYYAPYVATDVSEGRAFLTLDNLMKALKDGVRYECLRIEVRRGLVVEDALKEAAKKKFDPSKSLKVCSDVNILLALFDHVCENHRKLSMPYHYLKLLWSVLGSLPIPRST